MVAKNQLKLIKNLHQKKYRIQNGLFLVEGHKVIDELLQSGFKVYDILATDASISFPSSDVSITLISSKELTKISALKNPNGVLGVFYIPEFKKLEYNSWILALDRIQDPGNLGTIIRMCDWFGIENLVCSSDTVDCFNPKVLQATMGSIARVNVHYLELETFLNNSEMPIYGAYMNGTSVYDENFKDEGILVMGNEANGISATVEKFIDKKISIPQFGKQSAESLNVATATAILLNEIRRT